MKMKSNYLKNISGITILKNSIIFLTLILLILLIPPHLLESFLGIDLKKL